MAPSPALGLLSDKQAAQFLGLKQGTLISWRVRGVGPPFYRLGGKLIYYRESDLREWVEARRQKPTRRNGERS
jgi:predicted DNA-binding transcriptional regulator AlpA